ncbi:hypothetical protein ElyMa_000320900 [Elysia marginata]|uniref:Uncharacterized protein n=1 Tax=Elysia marginata TaxID=1093978 RepID=A0AAV4F9S4_9GAST|nr:hypothetical protein ElyMa_000320900 [Elysia marginata]
MDKAQILNLVGVGLLILALVLHIVCLATPNYSAASLNVGCEVSGQDETSVNFGMWKACLDIVHPQSSDVDPSDIQPSYIEQSDCIDWTSDTTFDLESRRGFPKTLKMTGRRVAASQVLAVAIAILPLARWEAKMVSIKNVLPQPPGASRKHYKPL